MHRLAILFFTAVLGGAALVACQTSPAAQPRPMAGFVTDMKAFDAFIATKPTPEQFHAAYPDVMLVTPDMMTTREMRQNNSRYFPKMDAEGHIVGGSFM
jgi:ABC-type hemin transport system substrate-binding protein